MPRIGYRGLQGGGAGIVRESYRLLVCGCVWVADGRVIQAVDGPPVATWEQMAVDA